MKWKILLTVIIVFFISGCGSEYYCDEGDVLSGQTCYKKKTTAPSMSCQGNYVLINGVCRYQTSMNHTMEPHYYCEEGELINSVCVIDKTYDAYKK